MSCIINLVTELDLHSLTFPNRTDTVVTRDATETLTNKTINVASNTIVGVITDILRYTCTNKQS